MKKKIASDTIVSEDKMTLAEFLRKKPERVSKKAFAEMLNCESIGAGMAVLYFNWK